SNCSVETRDFGLHGWQLRRPVTSVLTGAGTSSDLQEFQGFSRSPRERARNSLDPSFDTLSIDGEWPALAGRGRRGLPITGTTPAFARDTGNPRRRAAT